MGLLFTPVLLELHKSAVRTTERRRRRYHFNNLTNLNNLNQPNDDPSSIYLIYIAVFVFFSMVITCAVWVLSLRNHELGDDDWTTQTMPVRKREFDPLRLSRKGCPKLLHGSCRRRSHREEAEVLHIDTRPPVGGRTSFPVPVACAFNGMSHNATTPTSNGINGINGISGINGINGINGSNDADASNISRSTSGARGCIGRVVGRGAYP